VLFRPGSFLSFGLSSPPWFVSQPGSFAVGESAVGFQFGKDLDPFPPCPYFSFLGISFPFPSAPFPPWLIVSPGLFHLAEPRMRNFWTQENFSLTACLVPRFFVSSRATEELMFLLPYFPLLPPLQAEYLPTKAGNTNPVFVPLSLGFFCNPVVFPFLVHFRRFLYPLPFEA